MITALLVDDEPIARRGLRALLEPHREIAIVGECRNGLEARTAFSTLRPELVFLDVKMPDLDGFAALATTQDTPPAIVFVTAFEEHARRAFDVQAVDYLLKPFDRARFELALARALDRIATLRKSHGGGRLVIRDGRRLLGVDLDTVSHIVARGNYVRVWTPGGAHLHREPIGHLSDRLESRGFIRASRSLLVNQAHIAEVSRMANGRQVIILQSGARVETSRRRSRNVRKRVNSSD